MAARRRLVLSAVAAVALVTAGTAATALPSAAPALPAHTAEPAPGPHGIIDVEELMQDVDCDNAQLTGPAAFSAEPITGPADRIALDVLVLVDVAEGADIARISDPAAAQDARAALFAATFDRLKVGAQSYAPLGIETFFSFNLLSRGPGPRTDDAQHIIELAKAQYGGTRPAGIDIVYVVSDLDLTLPDLGNAVAGLADCIGGVALPDRAFAVGETGVLTEDEEGLPIGPFAFYKDLTAKIAAHEIGHLMGGHHHYQECGTPVTVAVSRGETGPCSLMTNAVDFQTLPFSTLNGLVVRGHAEQFAH